MSYFDAISAVLALEDISEENFSLAVATMACQNNSDDFGVLDLE